MRFMCFSKLFLSAVILLLVCSLDLLGQSNFKPGHVVTMDNDTIQGLIDYKGNRANGRKCLFKVSDESEVVTYSPDELLSYRFVDGKYFKAKALVSDNQKYFLEFLINGVVDVYYLRSKSNERYFIEDQEGLLIELEDNERLVVDQNNNSYLKRDKKYIGILKAVFKDDQASIGVVDDLSLSHKSLVKVAKNYHYATCSTYDCIVYEKKETTAKVSFGVQIGIGALSLDQTGVLLDYHYYLDDGDFGINAHPSVGVFVKSTLPFINEKLSVQYELSYSAYNLYALNLIEQYAFERDETNEVFLDIKSLNNLVNIIYQFPKGKIRPQFLLGGFYNYHMSSEFYRSYYSTFTWGEIAQEGESDRNPFENTVYGVNIGIGASTKTNSGKELFLNINYQRGFGLIFGMNSNDFIATIGYQIGK